MPAHLLHDLSARFAKRLGEAPFNTPMALKRLQVACQTDDARGA